MFTDKHYPVLPTTGTTFDKLPALEPEKWAAFLAEHTTLTDEWPVWARELLVPALVQAADDSGVILNFRLDMFFENHLQVVVSEKLQQDGDTPVTSDFNSFIGAVLEYQIFVLALGKLVFERHNNDGTIDMRLRLPV